MYFIKLTTYNQCQIVTLGEQSGQTKGYYNTSSLADRSKLLDV